jgi:predicted ATPase/DNA-binding SARP family transcriptional activator
VGLELTLLGTPHASVDGAPLAVDTRKAFAVLARLAVAGPRCSRDVLAAMLWPESPQDRARASLRRTLSVLTTGLGGRWVQADRSVVSLDDTDLHCDALQFRRLVARADTHAHPVGAECADCLAWLTEAAGLYHGDFMAGFALRDAPEFEDWVLLEGEDLRRQAGTVLGRLVAARSQTGDVAGALAHARQWLALDPLHEEAHRAVMLLAAWSGRRDEAIRQYRECVAALDGELGVTPLPETTRLYEAILEDRVTPPPPPPPPAAPARATVPAPPPAAGSPPLVGRDDELVRLQQHLGERPDAALVAIEGEAGIGKTRLGEELLALAATHGQPHLRIRCHEGEAGLACGPLADALRHTHRSDPTWAGRLPPGVAAEVSRLVPDLADPAGPGPTPLDSPGAQIHFFDALADALAAVSPDAAPATILLDDLHWADPTTVEFLGYVARRPEGRPLRFILTWRTEAVGHDHPLRRLTTETDAATLTLGRLGRDDVTELVATLDPGLVELSERLYEETEGIPFFVVQYVAALAHSEDWGLPSPVRDLVKARLRPLSDLALQCLTAAAVLGRSFDVPTLLRTSGRSEDELVGALDELLAAGLVVEEPTQALPSYDFAHTKIRDVVHDGASLARRRLLHRRAAEALALGRRDEPAAATRIANHYRAAGMEREAAHHFAIAGRHARSLFANREALTHLEAALALGHPDPSELQREIGDLHALAGRYAEARASYEAAAARADSAAELAHLEHRLGALSLRRGDPSGASGHLLRALELAATADPGLLATIRADLAVAAIRHGDLDRAADEITAARAAAGADPRASAHVHNVAGLIARRRGDLTTAAAELRQALEQAEASDDRGGRVAALNNLALVLRAESRHEDALAAAREALAACQAIGDRHREAALHSNVADVLRDLGRADEAMDHLKESARLLADVGEAPTAEPEIWKLTDW